MTEEKRVNMDATEERSIPFGWQEVATEGITQFPYVAAAATTVASVIHNARPPKDGDEK